MVPLPAGEPPAHPIRPQGPTVILSLPGMTSSRRRSKTLASEIPGHALPFLFSPSFLCGVPFPFPLLHPHILLPSPTLSLSNPPACLHFFVVSASSLVLSPPCLLCPASLPLSFIPLCFSPSPLLPGSPHILVSSPSPSSIPLPSPVLSLTLCHTLSPQLSSPRGESHGHHHPPRDLRDHTVGSPSDPERPAAKMGPLGTQEVAERGVRMG